MKKNALVTGGNSGIGYAVAQLLKQKGYSVTICGRNEERVLATAEELGVEAVVADMSKLEDIRVLTEKFNGQPLHALVNNAAIAKFLPLSLCTNSDFDDFINTNLRGPLELIKGLLPSLQKANGSICNISSAVVNNGLANAALYAATKGGIDSLTKSLAIEFAPLGVRVNAISPGAIDTPIITKLGLNDESIKAVKAQVESTIPMQRYGNSSEVADVVLAQLESSYTTGAIWSVDGGVNAA